MGKWSWRTRCCDVWLVVEPRNSRSFSSGNANCKELVSLQWKSWGPYHNNTLTCHPPLHTLFTLPVIWHRTTFGSLHLSIYYIHTHTLIYIYKIRFILSTLLWFCVIIPFGCSCCSIISPSPPAYLSLPYQTLAFLTLRYFTLHYITLRSIMRLSSELINSFYNENYIIAVMVIVYDHHYRPYHG